MTKTIYKPFKPVEELVQIIDQQADEIERLRGELLIGKQWAETLRAVYRHRGNDGMAEQISAYVRRLELIFPREPRAPIPESTSVEPAPHPVDALKDCGAKIAPEARVAHEHEQ